MKKMNYQNVKGTQDYLPDAERVRRNIRRTLEDVFIQYGCQPLETPILNYTELMASKYGGGAEILEEMYRLTDRGERDLALRYDLTIPFAKVAAMNPTLKMPFKRYEIGKVFRDGPIKTGRFREFTQCDVDMVGVDSQVAEAELMVMALDAFQKLNLSVMVQYNNRKLLTGMLALFGVAEENINRTVLILDKLEKVGVETVLDELRQEGLSSETVRSIRTFLLAENNTDFRYFEPFASQNKQVAEGLRELKELESYLKYVGVGDQCVFQPFLARGLEIYTGTVYEMFLTDPLLQSSIGSGGRYDNAIGGLIGTDQAFSTVGISFGLDVIYTAMAATNETITETSLDFYIIPLGCQKESLLVASYLRNKGYAVEVEMGNKKVGKALDKANREKVRQVIIIGESEVNNNQYKVKDMVSGSEKMEPFLFC
ncbi:histidine--tRNA ligase [Gracilibacillus phocaeensis]|uniref:histidine--tRNA ligase n=1 Tax=Gracilibacillus phocaeensis TaxID=2042304 RepID=UPI001031E09B|nr:histidine--tRNA ligase [Gracilibacillus phocaeensis]